MSCCQGWNIFIDKKTHLQYINADSKVIAGIAKESLQPVKGGKARYSVVRLNEQKACPFMDGTKLCTIHSEMGEAALSRTCTIYPRLKKQYADVTRHSMTLSCPEVARLVLFEENSMRLHEDPTLLPQSKTNLFKKSQRVDQVNQLIHLFAWNIIQSPSRHIEENLAALAHFILFLQRIEFDLQNKLSEAETYFEQLLMSLQSGESLLPDMSSIESVKHKVHSLAMLGTLVAKDSDRDSFVTEGHQLIANFLGDVTQAEPSELSARFAQIDTQWQSLCSDSCLSAPHVLRNYLLYRLYQSYFPEPGVKTIMRQFYRIVLDYFYVKHLLSVRSFETSIDEAAAMKTLAGISEQTMHSSAIDDRFDRVINAINNGDDLSCLLLIG